MSVRLLTGDCRETLQTLEPGSVRTCITSPPYHGLRDYGTTPLVWGQTCCEHPHEWGAEARAPWANELPSAKSVTKRNNAYHESMGKTAGQFCQHVHEWQEPSIAHAAGYEVGEKARWNHRENGRGEAQERILAKEPGWTRKDVVRGQSCSCGAWLGSLGLEPTPDLYIEHVVECFRHVRRVLRDDGVLWLNLGDSYAGSGKGKPGRHGFQSPASQMDHVKYPGLADDLHNVYHQATDYEVRPRWPTYAKPKDLLMIPFRVAMALQADGWYLRSVIPWLKRNSMPESVTDRPSTSVEYVFLLAKSNRYYWDADAVRIRKGTEATPEEYARTKAAGTWKSGGISNYAGALKSASVPTLTHPNGRNRRNSDWFFESWQGLLLDEDDDPLAFVVNPQPFSGSHFATFPPRLVEPMIRASTRAGDTLLDPFGGAGTVGLVADRLGRSAVLCELKPDYADMGAARIAGDAPLFSEVVA